MSTLLGAEYPVAVVCRVLATPRSTAYARQQAHPAVAADQELETHIERISGQWPTYGYRRVTAQLRRDGVGAVNGKRVRRLMHPLGLAGHAPARRCRTTHSAHRYARSPNVVAGLAVTQPDAVWVGDITYVRVRTQFVSLAVLMDVYTRAIRGWELSRQLDQALTLAALERAVTTGHAPSMHRACTGHAPGMHRASITRTRGCSRPP